MKKNTIIGIIVVVALIMSGVILIRNAKKRDAASPIAEKYQMVVSTTKPELKEVQLTLPALAIVQNDKDVALSSKIAARIEYLKQSGTTVHKGDVIVKLDNTVFKSNIESIKSQLSASTIALKNLQATHNRTLELIKVQGASIEQSEMEESKIAALKAQVSTLNQKLNELNNNLTYATIISPVTGVISQTMRNIGDMAMPGQPIAKISVNDGSFLNLRVPADLPVNGVILNNKSYKAIPLNSTFNGLAEYKILAPDLGFNTGERIEVNVEVFNGKAIKLPFDAVLNRDGKSYVFVKENDKGIATPVNIIQTGAEGIVVSNNDLAGKEIVVEKQDILLRLLSGVSLKVKED